MTYLGKASVETKGTIPNGVLDGSPKTKKFQM